MIEFNISVNLPENILPRLTERNIGLANEAGARHYRNRLRSHWLNAPSINPRTLRRVTGNLADNIQITAQNNGMRQVIQPTAPYAIFHSRRFAPERGFRDIWVRSMEAEREGILRLIEQQIGELMR